MTTYIDSGTEKLIKYLVVKVLAGHGYAVQAVYEHIVNEVSPSVLAHRYGMSKHQLRGYTQRVIEKTGSEWRAKALLRLLTPYILRVKPIIIFYGNGKAYCSYCREEILVAKAEDHVRRKHKDLVNVIMRKILHEVMSPRRVEVRQYLV